MDENQMQRDELCVIRAIFKNPDKLTALNQTRACIAQYLLIINLCAD
jgi:hypothetical protein